LVKDKVSLWDCIYAPAGSIGEQRGRTFLAQALRENRLGYDMRNALADLIDAKPSDERRFVIGRRRGGRTEHWANSQISQFIRARLEDGEKLEAAVNAASEKFKKENSRIYEIWAAHRPLLEAALGAAIGPVK
jgi:hypothetical protein